MKRMCILLQRVELGIRTRRNIMTDIQKKVHNLRFNFVFDLGSNSYFSVTQRLNRLSIF